MSLTTALISRLGRVDNELARRGWHLATSIDSDDEPVPVEFQHGAGARCLALSRVIQRSPVRVWLCLVGIAAAPVFLLLRILG